MTKQSFLRILQYNIRKSLRIQESFLIDRKVREFNIVAIQKQGCNNNDLQSFSAAHNFFHLVKNSSSQSRTCIYINKHLRLNQWIVETAESNICLIRILTRNTDDKTQTLRLLNVYNLCSLSTTFTERSSIISRLNKLLKNDCKQLIIEDFNLHHSHWEKWRCFTRYTTTDTLLNVITNARLKLLLKSDTITREAHNQFTTIDLVFSSEKIQFMTCKCKIQIDLHQRLNHLSIITKLCLQTISVQLLTWWLWKKMNTEALSAYLWIHLSLKHSLDDKTIMNDRVCKIIRVLQKIIEKSTFLTKSSNWARDFWNQSCFEVVMKSRRLQIIWKTQDTLEAWNKYLKHNDYKNKIIQQMKCAHFRTQMHELSEALKLIWCFAKWARIESQLSKKLSQFSSLKRSDIDHMTTTFKKKIEILREKFFLSSSQANVSDIAESFIFLTVSFNSRITEDEVKQTIRRVKVDKASSASDISNRALQASLAELISELTSLFNACVIHKYHSKQFKKDSDNSTMQIEEKRLYWFKDVSTHCFAQYHEQSAEVDHDQKTEWHSRDSSHAIKCSNESETQAIRDLNVRSTSRSSSHSVRLWNQICDLHAKLRRRRSVWSSFTRQTSAHAENEKNIELHNWINTQLSKELRDVANIQWTNERHTRDKRRHIAEIFHFIDSLSILQRKFNWKMRSTEN